MVTEAEFSEGICSFGASGCTIGTGALVSPGWSRKFWGVWGYGRQLMVAKFGGCSPEYLECFPQGRTILQAPPSWSESKLSEIMPMHVWRAFKARCLIVQKSAVLADAPSRSFVIAIP